jgi:hypothetical protein
MAKINNQTLSLLQQFQRENPEVEELIHPDKTKDVEISKLIRPSYSNREVIPSLFKILVKSLYEHGFVGGVITNRNLHVIDGWHRVEIWQTLGNTTIPCFILDVDPNVELKLHLSLNRQVSQFNLKDFGFEDDFSGIDLVKDFGFTKADLIHNGAPKEEEEYSEEIESIDPNAKLVTSIPKVYHKKLENIKLKLGAPNKSQTLILLIDHYENSNC